MAMAALTFWWYVPSSNERAPMNDKPKRDRELISIAVIVIGTLIVIASTLLFVVI